VTGGLAAGTLFSVVVLVVVGLIFRIVPVPSPPGAVVVVLARLGIAVHEAS
jgi:hypothetical protein